MIRLSLLLITFLLSPKVYAEESIDEVSTKVVKTAALIYKLYFFVDFPISSDIPQYCFVGKNSFDVARVLEDQQTNQQLDKKIKVTQWQTPSEVDPKQCNIIYSAPVTQLDKDKINELSKLALTISDSLELRETGHISSITYQEQEPILSFSRRNLKRSAVIVNSQLIRLSDLRP